MAGAEPSVSAAEDVAARQPKACGVGAIAVTRLSALWLVCSNIETVFMVHHGGHPASDEVLELGVCTALPHGQVGGDLS